MMKWLQIFSLLAFVLIMGCATTQKVIVKEEPVTKVKPAEMVTITAPNGENLREWPNGKKIGEAENGAEFEVLMRRGNWIEIKHPDLGSAWVWAPSAGKKKVDIISLPFLLGNKKELIHIDSLASILGPPAEVDHLGAGVYKYTYLEWVDNHAVYGVKNMTALSILIDKESRGVFHAEVKLPPFVGKADELLRELGLPKKKSSGGGFEMARYEKQFPSIPRLDLMRVKGDFKKFSHAIAWKYSPLAWKKLKIEALTPKVDNKDLQLAVTLLNQHPSLSISAPQLKVSLYEGTRKIDTWTLDPADIKIGPGESKEVMLPVAYDPSGLDLGKASFTADIINAYAVPNSVSTELP